MKKLNCQKFALSLVVALATLAVGFPAQAQTTMQPVLRQDLSQLRQAVEAFLQRQSTGLPGEVKIEVGQLDSRLNLSACMQLEPFLSQGSRIWGKTAVGIRCLAPSPWTIYVSSYVSINAQYLTAATPLAQGQTIGEQDFILSRGDLTQLPNGVITDPALAIGRTAVTSIQLGAPLRQDILRAQAAVQMGQTVRLLSKGTGFTVTTEGRAMNNATSGQTVQAKTLNGQIVSGIARAGGILEVGY